MAPKINHPVSALVGAGVLAIGLLTFGANPARSPHREVATRYVSLRDTPEDGAFLQPDIDPQMLADWREELRSSVIDTRARWPVDQSLLHERVREAIRGLFEEGFELEAVLPVSRGYGVILSKNYTGSGFGGGFGFAPTDGILVIGTR